MLEPKLLDAYRRTDYFIHVGSQLFCVHIGAFCPALDALFREHQCRTAALLSADNPRSVLLTEQQNQQRRLQYDAELKRRQLTWFEGFNRAQHGDWPDEQTRLLLGIDLADAEMLARQFQQNAFLFIAWQKPVQLCLLDFS